MPNDYKQLAWSDQLVDDCLQLVRLAIREDLDREQDWTTVALVSPTQKSQATIVARQDGVFCGQHVVDVIATAMQLTVETETFAEDGDAVVGGTQLVRITGNARDILTAERTILNFMGRLCGIATHTAKFVAGVRGTNVGVFDTRKTTPGWRRLEKFAVRCGGGTNHRTGLFDAILIKDNHLAFAGLVDTPDLAVAKIREFLEHADSPVEREQMPITVEVDSLEQLARVLPANPDIVLVDNMTLDQLREASRMRTAAAPDVILEASGGITLELLAAVAKTGIDRVSIGALTHSAINMDLGLDWLVPS
ncbi:MAG: carboxylating nicotinate-nucleotide diphosphorylase [Pirellulaceae bacterium]